MRVRILALWHFRSSYWFVPTLMTFAAIALASAATFVDSELQSRGVDWSAWAYGGEPDGARVLLSTIAGSMITVAGVTFSITIVALVLASSQFGPRVLYNFMRDVGNQVVLGTFVATFVYCLLVLQAVRGDPDDPFVPHASIAVALMLALASVGVFIYFIHHTAVSIHADNVVARLNERLDRAIEGRIPDEEGRSVPSSADGDDLHAASDDTGVRIPSSETGYVQAIDLDRLVEIASGEGLRIRLETRPGRFVVAGTDVARLQSAGEVGEPLRRAVLGAFVFGPARSPEYDLEFVVDQLVEVALRSLSSGINDPFTAMTCIDWLGAALCRIGTQSPPPRIHHDAKGRVRVIADPPTLAELLEGAFSPIAESAVGKSAVTRRLLQALEVLESGVRSEEDRERIRTFAARIREGSGHKPPGTA